MTQEKKKVTVQKTTDLTHEAAQACVIHGGITSPDTSLIGGIEDKYEGCMKLKYIYKKDKYDRQIENVSRKHLVKAEECTL